ncbi:MAG: MBL fold metallo-hydrolase [Chthoniobacterales bacterium]
MTYLGTNGYQLENSGHSILIDPYFSRISLARIGFRLPIQPDKSRIERGMSRLNRDVDAILVTHAHFDHLLDAPVLMRETGAKLVGSTTAVALANRAGGDRAKCAPVKPGDVLSIGRWRIAVLPAAHDRLPLAGVPFNGALRKSGPPVRASDWVCGEPLSYLITIEGHRIFIDSGGTPEALPSINTGPVDLAILGVALTDSRQRFAAAVRRLRPRFVLPSHQDDFFEPLDRGFKFGSLTDFEFVMREHKEQRLPGRLILMDYFRPWTLPPS